MFYIGKVSNLDANFGGYFDLFFTMIYVSNLYINLGSYFELSFMVAEMSNLYTKLDCCGNCVALYILYGDGH